MKSIHKWFGAIGLAAIVLFVVPVWANEIVIGYSGPLSGMAAEYGQDVFNGIELAVNEINAKGGLRVAGKKHTFRRSITPGD